MNLRLLNLKSYLVLKSHLFRKFSVECYTQRLLHLINILIFLLLEEEKIIKGEETEQWIVDIMIQIILFVITVISKDIRSGAARNYRIEIREHKL